MAKFTVRVEMYTPREDVYQELNLKMKEQEFDSTMGIQEKRFVLPRGEFSYESAGADTKEVLEKGTLIARTVAFHFKLPEPSLLVTKADGPRRWHHLGEA